jgi:hypothetical protein
VNNVTWRRSTRCSNGACVQVAETSGAVLVRDSKLDQSPILRFDTAAWGEFLVAVKTGVLR